MGGLGSTKIFDHNCTVYYTVADETAWHSISIPKGLAKIERHPNFDLLCEFLGKDFFDNHRGYEYAFPLDFKVYYDKECKVPMIDITVDMHMEPYFYEKRGSTK